MLHASVRAVGPVRVGGVDLKAFRLQQQAQCFDDVRLVVGDENGAGRHTAAVSKPRAIRMARLSSRVHTETDRT